MIYRYIIKPILFRFGPEFIHDVFIMFGQFLGSNPMTRFIIRFFYGYEGGVKSSDKDISKIVDGIKYETPVLLSAGFDYNGRLTRILPCVGFGGEEIGSVTARPCAGNPTPRMIRLPRSRSIAVNKGLRNDGVDMLISRMQKTPRTPGFVLGISIARTNDEKSATIEDGIQDYAYSLRRLTEAGIGDYYTINISCPNSFGGETFAQPELLDRLLGVLMEISSTRPIYVKMPINISMSHFDELLKIILKHKLSGVVIGNLNKDYKDLKCVEEVPVSYRGGLSGLPCKRLSTDLIKHTREVCGNEFTIIGVGGIMSTEDAREKFDAGADLIQLITGMIYEGPGLIRKICKERGVLLTPLG